VLVTLTRAEATAKALGLGVPVWITPVTNASKVRISTAVPTSAISDNTVPQPSFL